MLHGQMEWGSPDSYAYVHICVRAFVVGSAFPKLPSLMWNNAPSVSIYIYYFHLFLCPFFYCRCVMGWIGENKQEGSNLLLLSIEQQRRNKSSGPKIVILRAGK